MDTTATRANYNRGSLVLGCILLLLLGNAALAAEFEPRVTLGITYTDNVTLAAEDEQDETIYRAEPGFSFTHDSPRVIAEADYLLQAFRYSDLGQSEVYHQYDARLEGALIPDVLFLEIGGDRSQTVLDPELNIPQNNLPISGNRQDRDQYYVMPRFQYAIGTAVTSQGFARNSWVDYSDESAREAENRDVQLSIDNYRRGGGLTWALRYDWQRSDYDEAPPWEYQRASAELGYWLSGATRIFASGGKESAWDAPLDPAMEDDFWEAGFVHQVGERLSAEFAAGERTFGSSWRGNLALTLRNGNTSLSYQETPTTEARNPFRRGGVQDPLTLRDYLTRPGAAERFVSKRLEWQFTYALTRTSLDVAAFDEQRSDRTTADGQPLPDEDQRGLRATIAYQVGPRTDLSVFGSLTQREFGAQGTRDLLRGGVMAAYRLGARTTVSLAYDYAEEDPDEGALARDYVANTVSLFLTRSF